jgi:hypothetical protein
MCDMGYTFEFDLLAQYHSQQNGCHSVISTENRLGNVKERRNILNVGILMCDNNATVSLAKLPPGGTTETLNLFIFR